ncbi:MAG: surface carbohydrate biosynthesis protein [Nitrospirales bacterium]
MSLPDLLIPVENQVRELDAKLFLGYLAAQKGFPVIFGWKTAMENAMYRFPRGIYLAKSFAPQNLKMLRLIKGLGHTIVAWDEEGLIHYPPEVYWGRRITPAILPYLDHMIAWGQDYAELLETYQKPFPVPIHNLGNPRGDFLRSELHPYYHEYVQSLRNQYGRFILVNTNFPSVNSFDPELQLARLDSAGQNLTLAKGSQGMPEGFAKGRFDYKHRLFKAFQDMVRDLGAGFPDTTILVRPHPSENFTAWLDLAKASPNIIVKNEDNVLPWILACSVLIHNGCTTGVEGFALGKPVLVYQPFPYEKFESDLPNELSTLCSSMEDLVKTINRVANTGSASPGKNPQIRLGKYLTAMDGPFASDRIVDLLVTLADSSKLQKPETILYGLSFVKSLLRHRKKRTHEKKGTLRYSPAFQQQRFPELQAADLQKRIGRFQKIVPGSGLISVTPFGKNVFTLSSTSKS